MIVITLTVVTCVIGYLVLFWAFQDEVAGIVDFAAFTSLYALFGGIIWLAVTMFLLNLTTGLQPGYSEGERSGYINKLSVKGIIWKTHEGELQLGAGEAASLQPPFAFSVVDPDVLASVKAAQASGARVSVTYRQWLVMPFRVGESGYEVTQLTPATKDTHHAN